MVVKGNHVKGVELLFEGSHLPIVPRIFVRPAKKRHELGQNRGRIGSEIAIVKVVPAKLYACI